MLLDKEAHLCNGSLNLTSLFPFATGEPVTKAAASGFQGFAPIPRNYAKASCQFACYSHESEHVTYAQHLRIRVFWSRSIAKYMNCGGDVCSTHEFIGQYCWRCPPA